MLSSFSGMSALNDDGGMISTLRTFSRVEKSLSPMNSRSPVSIS